MLKFILPITPTAQQRARVAVRGKFVQAYKTAEQKANERTLEACLLEHKPKVPLSGPLVLEFVAAIPIPRSATNKRLRAITDGTEYPRRFDLDNAAKQLADALTRMQFWHDDSQICSLRCDKLYANSGYWLVSIYEAVGSPGDA